MDDLRIEALDRAVRLAIAGPPKPDSSIVKTADLFYAFLMGTTNTISLAESWNRHQAKTT
jgi:hypothetical protein